ncbi:hypothetical protein ZWY2020_011958 [Hordeum vulgare]|nr:hypothetical protein ZWY2020_011958 [Hordeum vulgare]
MEMETMSSAFAGFKIKVRANTRQQGRALGNVNRIGDERARRERQLHRDSINSLPGKKKKKKKKKNPPPRDDEEEEGAIPIYRRDWETSFGGVFGSFEDETALGPMRYTSGPIPENAFPATTLQVFSIRVTDLNGLCWWPLHVYGLVAIRDGVDHNRNFLFRRTRDNYQILTEEDPFLMLTGPSRAVMLVGRTRITFEVQLKVKGKKTESEDRVLASKVFHFRLGSPSPLEDGIHTHIPYDSCTLDLSFAPLRHSVEATVSVQLVDGSWPDGHQGQIFCCATGIEDAKMLLLDCRDGNMPIGPDGMFALSRRVVCAELSGRDKLMVSVQARRVGLLTRNRAVFEPKMSGTSVGMWDLRFCKMQVTVAWSLLSTSRTHAGGKSTWVMCAQP